MMDIKLFSGSANPALAAAMATQLRVSLGRHTLTRFADGELHVHLEDTVRGRDVYLLQSTCPPVHENLMELLVMIDACHRAAAGRITAVLPYYGYSRQEKMSRGREAITARLVADLITVAGAQRVVSIDLHSAAMQGFFSIGMDHLTASELLIEHLQGMPGDGRVMVSPDAGRVKFVEKFARRLKLPLVILHKERLEGGEAEVHAVIGDVKGCRPIIVDDMITTGGTIQEAVRSLLAAGAEPDITVVATHGLLVGKAMDRLEDPAITQVVITDSVPLPPEKQQSKIHVLSVSGLLAEAVRRMNEDRSVSALFPS